MNPVESPRFSPEEIEKFNRDREASESRAAFHAEIQNTVEGRGHIKGIFNKDKKPVTSMDISHKEANEMNKNIDNEKKWREMKERNEEISTSAKKFAAEYESNIDDPILRAKLEQLKQFLYGESAVGLGGEFEGWTKGEINQYHDIFIDERRRLEEDNNKRITEEDNRQYRIAHNFENTMAPIDKRLNNPDYAHSVASVLADDFNRFEDVRDELEEINEKNLSGEALPYNYRGWTNEELQQYLEKVKQLLDVNQYKRDELKKDSNN